MGSGRPVYLAVRPALDGAGIEFGARAYGTHDEAAATAMVEQIQAWDRQARSARPPRSPSGRPAPTPTQNTEGTAMLEKTHGLVTISWPAAGSAPPQARMHHPQPPECEE